MMEEVDMKEWASRLKTLSHFPEADPAKVPGLKLLHFFENMCDAEEGHVVSKTFETAKTRAVTRSLRECGAVRAEWIEMNVGRWREEGFVV